MSDIEQIQHAPIRTEHLRIERRAEAHEARRHRREAVELVIDERDVLREQGHVLGVGPAAHLHPTVHLAQIAGERVVEERVAREARDVVRHGVGRGDRASVLTAGDEQEEEAGEELAAAGVQPDLIARLEESPLPDQIPGMSGGTAEQRRAVFRVQQALYLIVTSPEFSIQK